MTGGSSGGLLKATASNAVVSGVVGGLVGGFIGAAIFVLIADGLASAEGDLRLALLVLIVPVFVGVGVAAWPDLSAGQIESALRRSAAPAGLALAAGAVGLLAATPIYDTLASDPNNPPAGALGVAFAVVAGFVGASIGVVTSPRKALLGIVGGLIGGFIGGLLIAGLGGGRNATAGQLLVAVPIASAIVGGAIGTAERVARKVWIDVVDGPLGGRELILYGDRVMLGSSDSATVSLADTMLEPEHCEILVFDDRIDIRSLSPEATVNVNDAAVASATVTDADLIEIGITWLRIRRS